MTNRPELPTNRQIAILRDTLERWRNTYYLAGVDHEIGEAIADTQIMTNAKERMRNALIAIDLIEKKIEELMSTKKEA
jgi:hypothetical protein